MMTEEHFGGRVFADMEVALRRACDRLPRGSDDYEARKFIAMKILECAQAGRTTLGDMTAVGQRAVAALRKDISVRA
jgi:hypothetical protein